MKTEGIGIDIVEISRFKKLKKNSAFLKKIFTPHELSHCFSFQDPFPHLAGIFAAKEAAFKATGRPNTSLYSIEVRHGRQGKPELWRGRSRVKNVLVSISHTDKIAAAVAVR